MSVRQHVEIRVDDPFFIWVQRVLVFDFERVQRAHVDVGLTREDLLIGAASLIKREFIADLPDPEICGHIWVVHLVVREVLGHAPAES